jgi:hypothetical protein
MTGLCPVLALVREEYAYVQGELLYALVVCALCFSLVLSRMCRAVALPKGCETCLLQVFLLFAFSWLSIASWSFFYSFLFFFSLRLLYMCFVNAIIKGEIEDHVWFEDRWMVASWCDE